MWVLAASREVIRSHPGIPANNNHTLTFFIQIIIIIPVFSSNFICPIVLQFWRLSDVFPRFEVCKLFAYFLRFELQEGLDWWPHLVVPYTEKVIFQLFACKNWFWCVFKWNFIDEIFTLDFLKDFSYYIKDFQDFEKKTKAIFSSLLIWLSFHSLSSFHWDRNISIFSSRLAIIVIIDRFGDIYTRKFSSSSSKIMATAVKQKPRSDKKRPWFYLLHYISILPQMLAAYHIYAISYRYWFF